MRKLGKIFLVIGLVVVLLFGVGLYPILTMMWNDVTVGDPDYTRYTNIVLGLMYVGLTSVLATLVIGIYVVIQSIFKNIFVRENIKFIKIGAILFTITSLLTFAFFAILTFGTTGGTGPTGIYVLGVAVVFLMIALFFYFAEELFIEAVKYREENDLTV